MKVGRLGLGRAELSFMVETDVNGLLLGLYLLPSAVDPMMTSEAVNRAE